METETDRAIEELAKQIEKDLYENIGPLLFGEKLHSALGFPSNAAFRQALSRQYVAVEIFTLPNRRGKFALSRDVARFLAQQIISGKENENHEN